MPPPAPSLESTPTPPLRRQRVPGSPALGEPVRRRSRLIVDRETQISMADMRQNIRDISAAIQRRDIAMVLPKLQSVDVLFRQPGRRLLSDCLLRPWKRVRTLPEPDDVEPLMTPEEPIPEPVAEPAVEPVAEPAAEPMVEPAAELMVEPLPELLAEPQEMPSAREEGSLEEPRDPSLQDTSVATGEDEFQLPVPDEQALLDVPEPVPVSHM
ncbi:hypothetical protein MTO96_029386 [Rhipicephalus appendiculatus]